MQVASGKIKSHNEWDKLVEIIVGTAEGSMGILTWTKPTPIPEPIKAKAYTLAKKAFPAWFLEEVAEDLKGLADTLQSFAASRIVLPPIAPEPHSPCD